MLDDHDTDHPTDRTPTPAPDPAPRRASRRLTLTLTLAGLVGVGVLALVAALGPDRDAVAAKGPDRAGAGTQQTAPERVETEWAVPDPAAQEPPVPEPTEQVPVAPEPTDLEAEYSVVSGQHIETPCWAYEGPALFVDNISAQDASLCHGALELWGELHAGIVVPRGVGSIYGRVQVEAVRVSSSSDWAGGAAADDPAALGAVIDTLAATYFAENGPVLSLHEDITLGGVPANVTRVEPTSGSTRTKAFITAFAPRSYTPGPDEVRLFVIAVVTPYGNGDELIEQVADTWRWQ